MAIGASQIKLRAEAAQTGLGQGQRAPLAKNSGKHGSSKTHLQYRDGARPHPQVYPAGPHQQAKDSLSGQKSVDCRWIICDA